MGKEGGQVCKIDLDAMGAPKLEGNGQNKAIKRLQLFKEDNSLGLRIGTCKKSDHWKEMFVDKIEDI